MKHAGWVEHILFEIKELMKINRTVSRPLAVPLAAGLAAGLPVFVGQYFGDIKAGLIASLGGMAFLYLPSTNLVHRMVQILSASALMGLSFFFGLLAYHLPALLLPIIVLLTAVVTMMSRFFKIGPPGNLFLLMSAMIAAYMPHEIAAIPRLVGLHFLGSMLACVIAFFYTLYGMMKGFKINPMPEPVYDLKLVVVDSLITAVFVGIALWVAQMFQLDKPYWVPVSCLAVMQGVTFRAVWTKQTHRIVGTAGGMVVSWLLLSLNPQGWWLCGMIMMLSFLIEVVIIRHYAIAMLFITPITIFLAEAGNHGMDANLLIYSRFIDIVIGSLIGLSGALALHYLGLRDALERWILRVFAKTQR